MLSIRLKPELEARLIERARREGVTKSKWVNDLLARELHPVSPYELLLELTTDLEDSGEDNSSENVSQRVRAKLRAKHNR